MDTDDADLIALIDGEVDETRARELRERIAGDVALRQRYEALGEQRRAVGAAFDTMLSMAPVARLKAFIPAESTHRRTSRFAAIRLRELAAGLLVGFALAASWFALRGGEEENWRTAVVDYMALYTNETFAQIPENREARVAELSAVGAHVGAKLTPEIRGSPRTESQNRLHPRLRKASAGRGGAGRSEGRPGSVLRHRQFRAGCAAQVGKARGLFARLLVSRRKGISCYCRRARGSGDGLRAHARSAFLRRSQRSE